MTHALLTTSRMPRRRLLTRVVFAAEAAALPLLAACANPAVQPAQPTAASTSATPQQAAPATSAGTVTLDWWVPNFHAAGAGPIKAKFEAANPTIKLNQIETVSQGLFEKIFTTLQGSNQRRRCSYSCSPARSP